MQKRASVRGAPDSAKALRAICLGRSPSSLAEARLLANRLRHSPPSTTTDSSLHTDKTPESGTAVIITAYFIKSPGTPLLLSSHAQGVQLSVVVESGVYRRWSIIIRQSTSRLTKSVYCTSSRYRGTLRDREVNTRFDYPQVSCEIKTRTNNPPAPGLKTIPHGQVYLHAQQQSWKIVVVGAAKPR